MKNKVETQQGITLIMLVVTIVVILILAGVSYHLVIGNNGIITKAEEAKVITRAGQVEEEVALWKSDTYIADHTNATSETESEMIERLRFHKFITEDDEVDTVGKMIKIKKKDGTVVKEIAYSNVVINISKTPESGNTTIVILKVTSIEGLEPIVIKTEEDILNLCLKIEKMDMDSKIYLAKELMVMSYNYAEETSFKNFTEFFNYVEGNILGNQFDSETEFNDFLMNAPESALEELILGYWAIYGFDRGTGELKPIIINPNNALSDEYIATENGTYTFKVKDAITNKIYTKTVEVTNISQRDYEVSKLEFATYGLVSKETSTSTDFEKAYVIYNNQSIEIETYSSGEGRAFESSSVSDALIEVGAITDWGEIKNSYQKILIIKEGEYYYGIIKMEYPE